MKTGIELIAEERQKQINKLGYDAEHDKQHSNEMGYTNQEPLVMAAIAYLQPHIESDANYSLRSKDFNPDVPEFWIPQAWPFNPEEWHGQEDSRLTQLVKAAALIVAEIDRELNNEV